MSLKFLCSIGVVCFLFVCELEGGFVDSDKDCLYCLLLMLRIVCLSCPSVV